MERKKCIVLFVFFVTLLCVNYMVDRVAAFKVLTEVHYTKPMMRVNVHDKSSHTRRSIQEQQADVCAGPTWNRVKQGESPCPTLVVWVPKRTSFTEFVKVNQQNEVEDGFSIAIFCYALTLLPYNVRPIFKPFIDKKGHNYGTYDQLVQHIKGKTCEAIAGDITMRGARAEFVSFTIPYLNADVYMLVRATRDLHQTLWTFFKPFTTRLWITLVFACFSTGISLAFLEFREHNPEFASPFYRQLVMVIWFPISSFFLNEGRMRNKCSKVVLVMWLSVLFMVLQIFTATLSSWLTLHQLRPPLSKLEHVGYPYGSFVKNFIMDKYNISATSLLPLNNAEDFKNVLSNGTVDVIFDELPYIELFLSKYGSEYTKLGPIIQAPGFAFAFSLESEILQNFSRAVLNVTESDIMTEMKKKYLGYKLLNVISQPDQAHPQSLDVQSFTGLFVFMGIVITAAITSSEIAIRQRKNKIHVEKKKKRRYNTR
ncbi:Extracellular solute-binding protein, family 3 [Artemisia annua]|uniref:Extracellular solute-binding protein, family 3 n=1 Tax=Artemisia annua TaxID=35608 RepID=A0A2U1LI25_ARTAN|nr:Extracellular solute-binding protein, family 3 [Artemisia annua]